MLLSGVCLLRTARGERAIHKSLVLNCSLKIDLVGLHGARGLSRSRFIRSKPQQRQTAVCSFLNSKSRIAFQRRLHLNSGYCYRRRGIRKAAVVDVAATGTTGDADCSAGATDAAETAAASFVKIIDNSHLSGSFNSLSNKLTKIIDDGSFALQSPGDIYKLLHPVDALQHAAVRQLQESAAKVAAAVKAEPPAATAPAAAATTATASAFLAHARAALVVVRRLGDLRAKVQRIAARGERLKQQQQKQQQQQRLAESASTGRASSLLGFGAVADAACPVPAPLAAELRAVADCMHTAGRALPLSDVLQLCCGLAQVRCCSPSLGYVPLQRLLHLLQQQTQTQEHEGIGAQEAALGLQLAASLLQQNVAEQPPTGFVRQHLTLSRSCRDRQQGSAATNSVSPCASPSLFASGDECSGFLEVQQRGRAAAVLGEGGALLRLSLFVSAHLLVLLARSKVLRKRLSLRCCVHTAHACVLLASQEGISRCMQVQQQQQLTPELFAAAVNMQPSTLSAASAHAAAAAAAAVSGHAWNHEDMHAFPDSPQPISHQPFLAAGTPRLSDAAARPPFAAATAAAPLQQLDALVDFGASDCLAVAALLRTVQQTLAPKLAILLLTEAAARSRRHHGDCGSAEHLLGVAMAAAAKASPTCASRKKLLLLLLRRLEQQKQQHKLWCSDCARLGDMYQRVCGASATHAHQHLALGTCRDAKMNPATLASICRSLAIAGVRVGWRGLSFMFDCIVVSLLEFLNVKPGNISLGKVSLASQGRKEDSKNSTAGAVSAVVSAAPLCSRTAAHQERGAAVCCPAATPSTGQSKFVVAYGSWCTVFWATSKLLKASYASVLPCSRVDLKLQQVLARKMLWLLVANIAAAEPADIAQIADGLRLLLLLDLKAAAKASPSVESEEERRWPLVLRRQRLFQVEQLLEAVQAITSHFMSYHTRFNQLELLSVLRLLVQLDLLSCIDCSTTSVPRGHAHSSPHEEASCLTVLRSAHVSTPFVASFLRCALGQYLNLSRRQHFIAQTAECPDQEVSASLAAYAQGLLLSIILKYPEELRRLPKALTKGVLKQAGVKQLSQCRWKTLT
ncbi:hypothetical protein, conserved [Eimeria maxima]|uniref:Uncharacterized protein n=1 Tax=Eimeria maxima TaxID=5804 RepID=U6MGK5_EIMMA|nr:hypothetical protein, conserved [Eimeria maxima]CDJ61574.1 hypothetical protein, conserved [Eimeria maxima]